jgi:DNA-binding XRE family transcriptional regulator
MLDNANAPIRWHAAASLPPFAPRFDASAQIGGGTVNNCPIEFCCVHSRVMGQFVPFVKAALSPAISGWRRHNVTMTKWLDEPEFNELFCARVARLRNERGWTQTQMAAGLGVKFERYKKYETRSPMPHYLIPRLAMLVDRDPGYVLTGQEPTTPRQPRPIAKHPEVTRPKPD